MTRLYVKPAEGRTLRDPERGYEAVLPTGKHVPRTNYWLRRIKHGDAIEAKPPKPEKPAKATSAKKED